MVLPDNLVVTWPEGVEEEIPLEAKGIIKELLHVDPLVRLGNAGIKDVKEHNLFNGMDWDRLLRQKAELASSLDLENTTIYVDGSCKCWHDCCCS
jgi:hypothetical protein